MANKDQCINSLGKPNLEHGAFVDKGVFLRNLKKRKEVSKRYEDDDDESPKYGFKLASSFWKNATSNGDMSINEKICVGSKACSIAIHPSHADYYHVASLNLTEINIRLVSQPFVAQYKPVEESDNFNTCHYELLPKDGTTRSLHALQILLDSPFPAGKSPASEKDVTAAEIAASEYQKIVDIARWVRDKDGTLKED